LYFLRLASTHSPDALPGLIKMLDTPDYDLRQAASTTLGQVREYARLAVPALVRQIQRDELIFIRETAARSLADLGPDAASAAPALKEAMHDPAPNVRRWCAIALWRVDRDPAAIPVLIEELNRASDPDACRVIMPVLGEAGINNKANR
jgi:HEAT repeat protein